ncbi:MAG: hypothetical protein ABIT37_13920 [Luteolibacter sp.]
MKNMTAVQSNWDCVIVCIRWFKPLFLSRLRSAAFLATAIPCSGAEVPGIGIGMGPSTPFVMERTAPASAAVFKGIRTFTLDAPNISLNPTGDWSMFVAVKTPDSSDHTTGVVLSIGTPSDNLFTDSGGLAITWCAYYENPWSQRNFSYSFVVTGKDDAGTAVSARKPVNGGATFFSKYVTPLVSEAGFNDAKVHGLVIQRRAGVVEFWAVGPAGARMMDSGPIDSSFKGITDKPLRIGAAQLITQPSWPGTFLGYQVPAPVQGLVIYNGGCMTPVQMSRLYQGAHAQDVLPLQASRDDRYYPGTITAGALDELVSSKSGIITGTGTLATGASLLPASVSDDVIVDMDGNGQVLPRDPPPATTTKARFWGTRVGNPTDIRMRAVQWNTSTTAPVVVVDWVTVATGVANGQTWIGELPGVPHAFANYDCDVSWKDNGGNWTAPKRLYRRWSVGIVVGIGGQSIVQKMRDSGGTVRTVGPKVNGFIRAYYDMSQNSSGYQDQGQNQGWFNRYTTNTGQNFGETRMAERLALLADCPVGIGNFSVGGSPIATYLGNTDKWSRWKLFIQRNRPQIGIWGNGQGDTNLSKTQRFAALDQLLAQYDDAVRTAPGGPWNYKFLVYPMNGDWSNGDNIRTYDMEWAASRAGQGKPVGVLCYTLDTITDDGTHLVASDSGLGTLAYRMAETIAHAVGSIPHSGLGPRIDRLNSFWSATGSVTTVNMTVIQNGGTALVAGTAAGVSPSGFKISVNGGAFAAPASALIVDATHITLTANIAGTNSVAVTYQAGYPGTLSKAANGGNIPTRAQAGTDLAVYDTRSDGLIAGLPGFPLEPIPSAHPLLLTKQGGVAVDSDGDGIPDHWEDAHGLNRNSAADASLDCDNDGTSNLQEFKNSTDPWKTADTFRFKSIKAGGSDGNTIELVFASVEGYNYRVESTSDMTSSSWTSLGDVAGTGGDIEVQDLAVMATEPKAFYRVRTLP